MFERTITVVNRAGIHARPASLLVEKTKDFKCSIHFECGSNMINAKSILGIITLGAAYGDKIKIIAEGEDEKDAVETLERVFLSKFEEE
ncbi:MAG: HPr family phosphocarrier protein [Spirochaetaceae bacterium]|jgi:phosphocarrier protein|nr:HPr family phosphocarrier protein [Spirochaetaceae bacterium]